MTASKSSRARNARTQRNPGAQAGGRNGTAVAARGGATAVKPTGRPQAAADRRGPRGTAVEAEAALGARASGTVPLWLQIVTFAVALAGLGVSIYLTIAHFTESALIGCSESGLVNCTKVTTSPQSYAFGIPVAVLGLAFYVFAVAMMSPWAWQWQ